MANMSWDEMRQEAEKTGGFAPHPIGSFRFKVIGADTKKGSTGSPQILARLENQDAGPNHGKTVLANLSPLKNDGTTNGMFYQQLGALGFTNEHPLFTQLSQMTLEQGVAFIASSILGAECMAEITHKEWANEVRDNVKKMKPVGASGGGVLGGGVIPVVAAPAPAPAPVPVVPTPAPAPVQAAPAAPSPIPAPPAPAPAPAPVQATEATPAPTTVEQVVAQVPTLPIPPDRPF